jgi:hypothetical protein
MHQSFLIDLDGCSMPYLDMDMIALGIRQPWAELILRGIKTIEVRSTHTAQRGAIYVYASKKFGGFAAADHAITNYQLDKESLPRGLIVGTVEIVNCRRCEPNDAAATCVPPSYLENHFSWILANPQQFDEPLTVRFLPYGVWFYPWKRRNSGQRQRS